MVRAAEKRPSRIGANLTAGPIFRGLMAFAAPIILTNLIQQLYSLVDLVIIGQYVGSAGTVGVSTGGEIADIMTPLATAFALSGQVYISQLVGVGQQEKAKETVGSLLSIMLTVSAACALLTVTFCDQILMLLRCPAEAFGQAKAYMIITALGMPFVFGYNGVCGALRGMGESKRPLLFVAVAACINIAADLLMVAVFHLEAAGTAIATVLSQMGSFTAALLFLYRHREQMGFQFKPAYFKIQPDIARKIVTLAIPQMVRSLLVRFSMLWVNASINEYGLIASATNSVGNKIQKFMEVYMQGVDSAAATMVGQNLGARKHDRAKKTILCTWGFCMAVAAVSSLLFLLIPRQLYRLFTPEEAVIEFGVTYLRIMVMTIFVNGTTGAFQSMVTGSGFVSLGFLLGILDGVVSRIGFSILFLRVFHLGVESYFWGTAFSRTLTGVVVAAYFLSGMWKRRRLLTETK
ncbi:MAG: MATE family efflux transporter [Muribaculaceae bacterium]|nr:MATE family efflux transporter [Muribaculaceae bacterium]